MTDDNCKTDSCECHDDDDQKLGCGCEGFGDLLKFTIPGYIAAILTGGILDFFGFHTSGFGQVLVRTLAGEGESILEGIYSMRQRVKKAAGSLAEAYGWGKLFGMGVPWLVDGISRLADIDMYGAGSFYVPYFYALSDQIGANVAGSIFIKRQQKTLKKSLKVYFTNPVMITSLIVILIAPIGLLMVRLAGFSPTTQKYTALETIAANLCWLPVVVGWLAEKMKR